MNKEMCKAIVNETYNTEEPDHLEEVQQEEENLKYEGYEIVETINASNYGQWVSVIFYKNETKGEE